MPFSYVTGTEQLAELRLCIWPGELLLPVNALLRKPQKKSRYPLHRTTTLQYCTTAGSTPKATFHLHALWSVEIETISSCCLV